MNILICGAQGFIGRHLCQHLQAAGHKIIQAQRRHPSSTQAQDIKEANSNHDNEVVIDFAQDVSDEQWRKRLQTIIAMHGTLDLVINAVGILRETSGQTFSQIHAKSPSALFRACAELDVKGIVQISALGPAQEAAYIEQGIPLSDYLKTKREADAELKQLSIPYLILKPSLVVGEDGASSRLFRCLASLPVIGLPGDGEQQIQPVHIDDLCHAVTRFTQVIAAGEHLQLSLNAVGPEAMSYRQMLLHYRQAMAMPAPLFVPIPMWTMHAGAKLAQYLPQQVFAPETLNMLCQHNVAAPEVFERFIKRPVIAPESWFKNIPAEYLAQNAYAMWTHLALRWSLAMLWIISGIVSLGLFPREQSYALLQAAGIGAKFAPTVLNSAALLDIVLGVLSLTHASRRLWLFQIALIIVYSAIIAAALPDYLLQPFGPITKNLPILASLLLLAQHQRKPS